MRISFVACGNGYGHMKRVLEVVEEILAGGSEKHLVQIVGATAHQAMFDAWIKATYARKESVCFVNGQTEMNVGVTLPKGYTVDDYQQSLKNIYTKVKPFGPDVVVSDNLVGILNYFSDAILMGSFMWGDVLETGVLGEIAMLENALALRLLPEMIGVGDIVMPGVLEKARFTGLPWFCHPEPGAPASTSRQKNILVTGGGTGVLTQMLEGLAGRLSRDADMRVYVDSKLDQGILGVERFSFRQEDFRNLDWIVCRPGAGILTDAVRFRVPVCAVCDDNKEMMHNADCVERLQIGFTHVEVGDTARVLQERHRAMYRAAFESLETGGAARAAEYVLKRNKA